MLSKRATLNNNTKTNFKFHTHIKAPEGSNSQYPHTEVWG